MKKGLAFTALLLTVGLVLVGGVWGEKNSQPGTFSGTIAKVNLAAKEFVVRNPEAEMTFQWNNKTMVKGPGGEGFVLADLREGLRVTVSYGEGGRNKVANRVDVQGAAPKTLKGLTLPFDCGVSVC